MENIEKEIEDFIKETNILIEKVINMKEYTATAILSLKEPLILRIYDFLRKYKKLQEENKELKKSKYVYGIDMDFDYIPKKKIRDKIKELEDEYEDITQNSDFIIADIIQPKIEVLKELLEEED